MDNREKQLLTAETCARMMYGVKAKSNQSEVVFTVLRGGNYDDEEQYFIPDNLGFAFKIDEFKLLLRPMSSMSDEDDMRRCAFLDDIEGGVAEAIPNYIEWLNQNHYDYRGWIEKGLAIEAPEGTYNLK